METEEDISGSLDDSKEDCNYSPEKKKTKVVATVKKSIYKDIPMNFNVDFDKLDETSDSEEALTLSAKESSHNVLQDQEKNLNKENEDPTDSITTILKTTQEILRRLHVMERYMLQNRVQIESDTQKPEPSHHRLFLNSIGPPFDDIGKLQRFEKSLSDVKMNEAVVSSLNHIFKSENVQNCCFFRKPLFHKSRIQPKFFKMEAPIKY